MSNRGILTNGEEPNYLHGIKALVGIHEIVSSLDSQAINTYAQSIADGFSLIETEKKQREDFIQLRNDIQAEKDSLNTAKNDLENSHSELNIKSIENNEKLADIAKREDDISVSKRELLAREQSILEREGTLKQREGNVATGEALLADKLKQHTISEVILSEKEEAVKNKQTEIEALLGKIK